MSLSGSITHSDNINNRGEQQQQEGSSDLRRACASCKFQRKKCDDSCMLQPYFPTEKKQEFEACHRIFGVSNMSKMLSEIHPRDRPRAAESIVWEGLRWKEDPVNGPLGSYINLVRQRNSYMNQLNQATRRNEQLLNHIHALTGSVNNNYDHHHQKEHVPPATNYNNVNYRNSDFGVTGASHWSTDRHRPLLFQETDPLRNLGGPRNHPPVMRNYNQTPVVNNGYNVEMGQSSSSGFVRPQQILSNQQQLGGNNFDLYGSNPLLMLNGEAPPTASTDYSHLPPGMGGNSFSPRAHHQVAATRDGEGSNWTTNQIGQGTSNTYNHLNDNRGI